MGPEEGREECELMADRERTRFCARSNADLVDVIHDDEPVRPIPLSSVHIRNHDLRSHRPAQASSLGVIACDALDQRIECDVRRRELSCSRPDHVDFVIQKMHDLVTA